MACRYKYPPSAPSGTILCKGGPLHTITCIPYICTSSTSYNHILCKFKWCADDLIPEIYTIGRVTHWKANAVFSN